MTTTEAELDALMRLMESMEDSLRDMQDEWREMRDGLEKYLLAGESDDDSPSTTASSAATTPERPGQQKDKQSPGQQLGRHGNGETTLAMRGRKRPRELLHDDQDDGDA